MTEKEVTLYTLAQVRENANSKKPWIVIEDSVYDVTEFLNDVRPVPSRETAARALGSRLAGTV